MHQANVIPWAAPVPSFGDISYAQVATVGLNPSNREFVDQNGGELTGRSRRFHTLRSLDLHSWLDVDARHLSLILDSCHRYFHGNPYNRWFRRMENIISATPASFYPPNESACHLDLVPFATKLKWTELSSHDRETLFVIARDTLSVLLRDSHVRVLVLNGHSVVRNFQRIAEVHLACQRMPLWFLQRRMGAPVPGIAYEGQVHRIGDVLLKRPLLVLGYNHNPQSSFGMTNLVVERIREWIATRAGPALG